MWRSRCESPGHGEDTAEDVSLNLNAAVHQMLLLPSRVQLVLRVESHNTSEVHIETGRDLRHNRRLNVRRIEDNLKFIMRVDVQQVSSDQVLDDESNFSTRFPDRGPDTDGVLLRP